MFQDSPSDQPPQPPQPPQLQIMTSVVESETLVAPVVIRFKSMVAIAILFVIALISVVVIGMLRVYDRNRHNK